MESYEFTLELSRDIIDSEADTIKANFSDATIKFIPTGIDTGYTGTLVEFDREAESLEKAIESAMHDVETVADLHATGITIPAPERPEQGGEDTDTAGSAAAEPAGIAPADAEAAPAAIGAATEKAPAARKAGTKAATKKTGSRKTSARKEPAE